MTLVYLPASPVLFPRCVTHPSVEPRARFELAFPDYRSGASPSMLTGLVILEPMERIERSSVAYRATALPLSYIGWGQRGYSKPRPPCYECGALPLELLRRVWWEPRDSNSAPEGTRLQRAAANRICLAPKLGGGPENRTRSRRSAWLISSELAYHLPRPPWHRDEDSNPMRRVWNPPALPGAPRCETLAEG